MNILVFKLNPSDLESQKCHTGCFVDTIKDQTLCVFVLLLQNCCVSVLHTL